jgi:glycosyltransferase involved in cell wall biosynthesis
LEWILGAVFPHIQKKRADSELVVAGEVGRVRRWPNWVSLLGKQDSLVDTYARAAVVINPVKFGTGLPVKTIEALSYGKPIVATSAGGRDLEDFSDAISVADDPDTFTGRVLELLECKDTRLKISQRALAAASEWQRHQLIALDAAIIGQKPAYPKEAPIARDDEILYNPARKSIHHNPARKSNSS